MRSRLFRTIALALGAGTTAEFLLGDQWLSGPAPLDRQLVEMIMFTVFYGSGAVLIREIARRMGRGWPTILLLALAFGLIEEGVLDQTLFNPHYLGLDLLAYGYVPALGIGLPWTIFVLSLHVIFSIGAPIAVTEGLFPDPLRGRSVVSPQRQAPWLGRAGLVVVGLGYLLGAAAIFAITASTSHFLASPAQLATSLVLTAVLIGVALRLPRRPPRSGGSYWFGVLIALVATSALQLLRVVPEQVSPWLISLMMVVILAGGATVAVRLRADPVGLGSGAVLTYVWKGLSEAAPLGTGPLVEQLILVVLALAVLVAAYRRRHHGVADSQRTESEPLTSSGGGVPAT
ncbi:MAG: hypothetical protein L0H41_15500 [Microlunatus sp.]|nr:hypothetical protein [Microlunatus sp.]MDN5771477.1 hypothetical protein [Microlunatus sp.]